MSKQGYIKNYQGEKMLPQTTSTMVTDVAKEQALSATLANTPDKNTLGFPTFTTIDAYSTGDKVYYNNKLWVFSTDHAAGDWDETEVSEFSVKEYVDALVSSDSATFRGTFNLVSDLELAVDATHTQIGAALDTEISTKDNNDYCYVQVPTSAETPTEIAKVERYKYDGTEFAFEYELNNSGFTTAQWAAINSGITTALVEKLTSLPTADELYTKEETDEAFAKQDGWYSTLVSGASENLVGHGSVEAEYTFRTAGGDADIGSGTAQIDTLKGKTLKWQQMVQNGNFSNGTTNWQAYETGTTLSAADNILSITNSTGSAYFGALTVNVPIVNGHKYYVKFDAKSSASTTVYNMYFNGSVFNGTLASYTSLTTEWKSFSRILESKAAGQATIGIRQYYNSYGSELTLYMRNCKIFNLTEMFGAGNEPSTAAEFEALYPLDYYAYTSTPVLINNAASGIKTTGFNRFDADTVFGNNPNITHNSDGSWQGTCATFRALGNLWENKVGYTGRVCVHGIITQTSGANFRIRVNYTDNTTSDYIITSTNSTGVSSTGKIVKSVDAYYGDSGTVTIKDLNINFSWSGYRNGEYEPYEEHTLYFNGESGSLATITGKRLIDGEPTGESVTIFPEGMKSVGSVYDFGKADSDGYIRKVTKTLFAENLTGMTENLLYAGTSNKAIRINSTRYYVKRTSANIIAEKYAYNGSVAGGTELSSPDTAAIGLYSLYDSAGGSTYLYAVIPNNSSLSGYVYYELYTPMEYLLDTPIPANYIVNDFGTEERLPSDTSSTVLSPLRYSVSYAMNATDTLRRLPVNYISVESMEQYLAARGTLDGGTWAMSWDSEHERYNFVFTATEEQTEP